MKLCRITARPGRWGWLLLLVPVLAVAAGCATPVDTGRVAAAGGEYAGAMNCLLLAAGRVAVDASSERLLQGEAPADQVLEQYRRLAAADARRLEVLEQLRDLNRSLARYFSMLGELAGTPASAAIQDRLRGIAQSLEETTAELRRLPECPPFAAVPSPAAGALFSDGGAAAELRRDAPRLRAAFLTQEAVLGGLVAGIRRDFEVVREAREQRLVVAPLLSQEAVRNPEFWGTARRELLLLAVTIRELEKATALAGRLTADFDALLAGRAGAVGFGRLEEDAARLAAAGQAVAK